MALDAGELALTFVPAGVGAGTAALHVGTRGAVRAYLDDPAAWRAARQAAWRMDPERGAVSYGWSDGLPRVNGKRPRGYVHSGTVYRGEGVGGGSEWSAALKSRYPNGVFYNAQGFADFSPYATHTVQLPNGFTGSRPKDDALANLAAGLSQKPKGFTWHHVEDGRTMMLVPSDLHGAVPHTGGHAVIKPPK